MSTTPTPRRARRFVAAALAFASFSTLAAAAGAAEPGSPFLVKDFDPGTYLSGNNPRSLAVVGDRVFFSGWDAAHGDEPWVSDGSAAGTRRIADLCYGFCSSYPAGFTQLGEAVIFYDNDGHQIRIRRYEGGEVREVAVFDNGITQWTRLGSLIFFAPRDKRLWRTDGTAAGTYPVADFHPVPDYQEPPEMVTVNGAIYFADSGGLQRLTEDGEVREILSLGGSPGATATSFTALDAGRFLFSGCPNSFTPCRAYVSDGTPAGTRSLESSPAGELTAGASSFVVWRGRAYFETRPAGIFFPVIVSTDGTPAGTRRETFFPEGSALLATNTTYLFYTFHGVLHAVDASLAATPLTSDDAGIFGILGRLGEKIVFSYGDPGGIARPGFSRVATTSGTPGSTADLVEGTGDSSAGVATLGGFVYFAGGPIGSGRVSLWRTDGSAAGTGEVADAVQAPLSSLPEPFRIGAGLAVETTDDEIYYDSRHLYRIDPLSLEGERIDERALEVIAAGKNRVYLASSTYYDGTAYAYDGENLVQLPVPAPPRAGAVAADDHYFFFTDVAPGQQLWESDGSAAGTRLLHDFAPHTRPCSGWCGSYASLAISGDKVYFAASDDGQRLSVWDRAAGEKRTVRESPDPVQLMLPIPGGGLVFNQGSYFSGIELWKSDGTAAGTAPFHQIAGPTNLMRMFEMDGQLYFGLDKDDGSGEVLWSSDLTDEGTHAVGNLGDVLFIASAVAGRPGSRQYYFSTDKGAGRELGVTDGSAAGTRFFDLRPGREGSHPDSFFALDDGRLVFAASADAAGYELWISDGSHLGTYRLTDLNPGEGASAPTNFAQVGNRLFFQATDGHTGRELWGLDLPPAGASPCPQGSVCLLGGRFEISLVAHAPDGDFLARKEVGNDTSAIYSFFSPGNWEMLLKVLDGCAINGRRWVFAAAATDVGWTLRIRDRETGAERVYGNEPGQPSLAITDAAAFSCGGAFAPSLPRLGGAPIDPGAP